MTTQRLSFLLILGLLTHLAIGQTPFRFEAETGISSLQLPQPYRLGWHVRQQLTAYVRPRLGVGLGIGWGGSANNDPLKNTNQYGKPDPRALLDFYNRQERMIDLTAVWLPVFTRRHQLRLQAGLSLQRRREITIDSIFRERPGPDDYYDALPTYIDRSRVVPVVALGYDYRLSARWAMGINAATYLSTGKMTTLGLRTSYRFNVSRDSLGIGRGRAEPLNWGIRVAVSRVGNNGSSSASIRNITRAAGGLWAEYPLSLTWAMRGELNYAQRGYRSEGYQTSSVTVYTYQTEAAYLDLPLLFRHELTERWHAYGGPYLAFLLSGSSGREGQPRTAIRPHTTSGLLFGADYQVSPHLSLDLRYQRDLLEISTTPYNNTYHSYQLGLNWAVK